MDVFTSALPVVLVFGWLYWPEAKPRANTAIRPIQLHSDVAGPIWKHPFNNIIIFYSSDWHCRWYRMPLPDALCSLLCGERWTIWNMLAAEMCLRRETGTTQVYLKIMTFTQQRINADATSCIDVSATFYKRYVPAMTLHWRWSKVVRRSNLRNAS